jgi:hypothetical protein
VLGVDAQVIAESSGLRVRIDGAGRTLTARIDGGVGALSVLRWIRSVRPSARRMVPLLVRCGLTLEFVIGGVRVARAGAGVEANRLARVLDLANVHLGG